MRWLAGRWSIGAQRWSATRMPAQKQSMAPAALDASSSRALLVLLARDVNAAAGGPDKTQIAEIVVNGRGVKSIELIRAFLKRAAAL